MSLLHFDTTQMVDRIREQVPAFRQVGGAADFIRAQQTLVGVPAAFVLLTDRTVNTTRLAGGVNQHRCVARIDVAIAISNARAGGAAHQSEALALANAVVAALNWTPEFPGVDQVNSVIPQGRGRILVDLTSNDHFWWAEPFNLEWLCRTP